MGTHLIEANHLAGISQQQIRLAEQRGRPPGPYATPGTGSHYLEHRR